ncbi:MAG: type II toxin-antitoxin system HicB family antitoxin [Phycisphaeraceae bacterium]|nr:type II toxin-antitoxin system HicB family antitoxin [Phycisphaeraceae bacterium]
MRQVVIYKGEDGNWVAEVPSLPGCVSQGSSTQQALANVAEAISLWVETVREMGWNIPVDSMSARIETIPDPAA